MNNEVAINRIVKMSDAEAREWDARHPDRPTVKASAKQAAYAKAKRLEAKAEKAELFALRELYHNSPVTRTASEDARAAE